MPHFSSAVGSGNILHTLGGWKFFLLSAKPTKTKLSWGQSWRNHQQNEGLLFLLGSSTFMVLFSLWVGLCQLLQVFSTAIPSSSLSESNFCGLQETKTVCWSWVPPPPREGMKLKRLLAVNMVHVVCFRDNTKLWLRAPTHTSASSFSLALTVAQEPTALWDQLRQSAPT